MSKQFEVGDRVTVTSTEVIMLHCARDTTKGKAYTVIKVDSTHDDGIIDVSFVDDAGDTVILASHAVSPVKE